MTKGHTLKLTAKLGKCILKLLSIAHPRLQKNILKVKTDDIFNYRPGIEDYHDLNWSQVPMTYIL